MPRVGEVALKVRSKNAGPFWLTVDIFCADAAAFAALRDGLRTEAVARAFDVPSQVIKRFDIAELNVVKFSLPRPAVQGTVADRDMHGAAWGPMVAELEIG